jgi:hypothetical protein
MSQGWPPCRAAFPLYRPFDASAKAVDDRVHGTIRKLLFGSDSFLFALRQSSFLKTGSRLFETCTFIERQGGELVDPVLSGTKRQFVAVAPRSAFDNG